MAQTRVQRDHDALCWWARDLERGAWEPDPGCGYWGGWWRVRCDLPEHVNECARIEVMEQAT